MKLLNNFCVDRNISGSGDYRMPLFLSLSHLVEDVLSVTMLKQPPDDSWNDML